MTNDIEQARAARIAKLEHAQSEDAVRIARAYVERLGPDALAGVESVALMLAAISVCDAFGIPRETMLETFTELVRKVTYPAGAFK